MLKSVVTRLQPSYLNASHNTTIYQLTRSAAQEREERWEWGVGEEKENTQVRFVCTCAWVLTPPAYVFSAQYFMVSVKTRT